MLASIVDNALGAVLDEEFEELKTLQREEALATVSIDDLNSLEYQDGKQSEGVEDFVDLTPFFRGFVGEAFVDHGHNLIEQMAIDCYQKCI